MPTPTSMIVAACRQAGDLELQTACADHVEDSWRLGVSRAIALATRREITGNRVLISGPTLFICDRERREWITRELKNQCEEHDIPSAEIESKIHMMAPKDSKFVIAKKAKAEVRLTRAVNNIISYALRRGIKLIFIDPAAVFDDLRTLSYWEADALDRIAKKAHVAVALPYIPGIENIETRALHIDPGGLLGPASIPTAEEFKAFLTS